MEKFYEVRYMNGGSGELIDEYLSYEDAQAIVEDLAEGMQAAGLVVREMSGIKPPKYDVGSKVWCLEDGVEATVVEVSFNGGYSYSLRQSHDQEARTGKINWVAWLTDKDLEPIT